MKARIGLALVLGVAIGIGGMMLRPELGSQMAAALGKPCCNGDVNGDGGLDIGDAIYLLSYLFASGPAPEPMCTGGCLPATGQTVCYDSEGRAINCASPDYPGQDGFYQAGCPMKDRFVDNGDGTVTDRCTCLMWQKDTADTNGDKVIDDGDRMTWQRALKYCEELTFAGYGDWRLPNVRELLSIVDYGRYGPAIDPVFGALSDWYWSSSSGAGWPGLAWYVYFGFGYGTIDVKGLGIYVRAVRSGP